jgi:polysaccharide pyruvyl transferase WcaK-like protein
MRIAVFNARYSANLGDGILARCLDEELLRQKAEVLPCDLAGRTTWGEGASRRKHTLAVLDCMPSSLRRRAIEFALGREVRNNLQPRWREMLPSADAVLAGGGQLLADIDLNFPLKLNGLCEELSRAGKSWGLFAAGASAHWSRRGRELFVQAFMRARPSFVLVRDEASRRIAVELLAPCGLPAIRVCPDPAVLSHLGFPAPPREPRSRPVLGINLAAPSEIQLHTGAALRPPEFLRWFAELARLALEAGYEVRLFTNGNLADDESLRVLERRWPAATPQPCFLPRPLEPQALASAIAGCDVVIGHRLHLHIPAFSYRIPSAGILWEEKMRSFFLATGREKYLLDQRTRSPREAWALLQQAQSEGVDEAMWRSVVASAQTAVREACGWLGSPEAGGSKGPCHEPEGMDPHR